ncbi:MAG: teichuronic acid biosynthesis glycosyltransferase TuaC [Solirubrobacteraceae bacterium]|nr:teichuronic acid biosynthesis glycosyltransferase TuaC [Solirubrobacteraceae bacterium]
MRVLAITNAWPHPDKPWYGSFVVRQMDSLPGAGVDVDVIPIYGRFSPLRSLPAYLRAARSVIALNFGPRRYDVVHAHFGHCGLLACLQFRYPVVLTYYGYDIDMPAEHREGARTKLERWVFIRLSRLVAATIVQSRRELACLPRRARPHCSVIPSGVDRDLFRPLERAEARRRLAWNGNDAPVTLFPYDPGRFTKRFALAQAAVEAARRRVPDLELVVCDRVAPDRVPDYMNAADALILSSVAEGSPNVVKEAMACNLPIVSVDVGDVRDVVDGTRNCHILPAEAETLGQALVEVLDALPERSDGRGRSAHLGLAETAGRLRAVYRSALGRGPGVLGFLGRRRSASA